MHLFVLKLVQMTYVEQLRTMTMINDLLSWNSRKDLILLTDSDRSFTVPLTLLHNKMFSCCFFGILTASLVLCAILVFLSEHFYAFITITDVEYPAVGKKRVPK